MAAVIAYWPAVVAGLYLLYVLAAGQAAQVGPAITAFITALGINHVAASGKSLASKCHSAIFYKPLKWDPYVPNDVPRNRQ